MQKNAMRKIELLGMAVVAWFFGATPAWAQASQICQENPKDAFCLRPACAIVDQTVAQDRAAFPLTQATLALRACTNALSNDAVRVTVDGLSVTVPPHDAIVFLHLNVTDSARTADSAIAAKTLRDDLEAALHARGNRSFNGLYDTLVAPKVDSQ